MEVTRKIFRRAAKAGRGFTLTALMASLILGSLSAAPALAVIADDRLTPDWGSPGDWGITVAADLPGYDREAAEIVVSVVSPLESQATGDPSYLGVQAKFWLLGMGAVLLGYVVVQLRTGR